MSLGAPRGFLAWALPAVALVATSGLVGLIEPTETRYAEIGREMATSGDWLTPRLNGISHFHKPPLSYWTVAGGMKLLGFNEWGARLGAALAAGFLLWCVWRLARRAGADASLAPLVLASTALFFALSHQLASDIFLASAVGAFWVAFLDPRSRSGLLPAVALAAGFMAKGPVVLVHTVLPAAVASLWIRDGAALRDLARWRNLLVFVLLALPWYVVEAVRTPGLASYWLGIQLWGRYTTTIQHRAGPWYYYVPVLLGGAIPWIAAAVAGTWRGAKAVRATRDFDRAALIAWAWAPAIFFSTSGSKLPAYVLPEFPAIALLAAAALGRAGEARGAAARISAAILLALAATIEWTGPIGLARLATADPSIPAALPLAAHAAALAFAVAGIACLARRPVVAAAMAFTAWIALLPVVRSIEGPVGSPRPLARLVRASRTPGEPVVEYRTFNAGLPFYLRERIPMLEVPRELMFETPETRARVVLERGDRDRLVAARGRVWVLARAGQSDSLASALHLQAKVVGRWHRDEMAVLQPIE